MAEAANSKSLPGSFNPLLGDVTQYVLKPFDATNYSEIDTETGKSVTSVNSNRIIIESLSRLSLPPRFTTLRVNVLKTSVNEAITLVEAELKRQYVHKSAILPKVYQHHTLPDLIVIECVGIQNVSPAEKEVIVDRLCGSSVLRGAEVFAPGIVGSTANLLVGENVSVYADLEGKCLKGSKIYNGQKMFVGNGVTKISRKELFGSSTVNGIAVTMKEKVFDSPSLGSKCQLDSVIFLQNLPSVLCAHVLCPPHHAYVLDMCAAPGGKASHIASLMSNTGQVIAIDRSQSKVDQIKSLTDKLGLSNVSAFKYDSTRLLQAGNSKCDGCVARENCDNQDACVSSCLKCVNAAANGTCRTEINPSVLSPPYVPSSFEWILLDAPCSALGLRPQIVTKTNIKELHSFPILQRKLLRIAIQLLKSGGKLVYSTCTIVSDENEEMVKWVLETFPDMELVDCKPKLGQPGLAGVGLSEEQCKKVQRFGPVFSTNAFSQQEVDRDTIGFFIAAFKKL